MPAARLSQETFDRIVRLARDIRDRAIKNGDSQTARDADRIDAEMHKLAIELIVEGRPEVP